MELRPFQKRFLQRAFAPQITTAALSIPRGNGKSTLAAHILERALTPGDPLFQPGVELLLGSSTLEQSRNVFSPLRAALEPTGAYRFIDSITRVGILHKASNTRLRVASSNAKGIFGLVGVPLVIIDEPGSLEVVGGQLLHDAIQTAMGKPESPLRVIYIGTIAPGSASGWWADLVDGGTHGSVYVQSLQGDSKKWDQWPEIKRCNPLMSRFKDSRAKLLEERDEARQDGRLKARYLSFRLNRPTADEAVTLLNLEDWERMEQRHTPERDGPAIVGIDLGGGRSWSAACGIWESGRVEALAVAPGVPSLEEQERRDRTPAGAYRALEAVGRLTVDVGLRVQSTSSLWAAVRREWGLPALVICDRFRLGELLDVVQDMVPVQPRVTRWSDASADIRALRKLVKDGPLAVSQESRSLIAASLATATVKSDDQGSSRLVKGSGNVARDDVAASLLLAAGAYMRDSLRPAPTVTHVVV